MLTSNLPSTPLIFVPNLLPVSFKLADFYPLICCKALHRSFANSSLNLDSLLYWESTVSCSSCTQKKNQNQPAGYAKFMYTPSNNSGNNVKLYSNVNGITDEENVTYTSGFLIFLCTCGACPLPLGTGTCGLLYCTTSTCLAHCTSSLCA